MKRPPFLKPGSSVRIISTARKISQSEVEPSIKLLESWGLSVQLGEHLFDEFDQFAGNDQARTDDLQSALNDTSVGMIWCSRGGYGTVKLIDALDFSVFLHKPKWVVGYSDITGLLCHLTQCLDVATLHATMPINITNTPTPEDLVSMDSLRNALFGKGGRYALQPHALSRPGNCSGQLIGGNLSIVYSLLGSESSPQTNGKILFLEDLDEYLYHIDRMMVNLKRNGLLSKLSGLVIGGLSDMNDNTVPYGKTAEEIVLEHVSEFDYPVYFGFDAGHVSPNLALPFGMDVQIQNYVLTF